MKIGPSDSMPGHGRRHVRVVVGLWSLFALSDCGQRHPSVDVDREASFRPPIGAASEAKVEDVAEGPKAQSTQASGGPPAPTAWTINVGHEEVLHTNANKPWRFPDGNIGIVPGSADGTEPFTFFAGSHGIRVTRVRGTLDKPARVWRGAFIRPSGVPAIYRYMGGGPVHRYATNKWVMFAHGEVWRNDTHHHCCPSMRTARLSR